MCSGRSSWIVWISAATVPLPSEAVYKAELEQLKRDLRLFLKLEVARRSVQTVAVEVPFGFVVPDREEPLSRAEPVLIRSRRLTAGSACAAASTASTGIATAAMR